MDTSASDGDTDYSVVEFALVRLDESYTVLERDPVGRRMWVVPPGDSAYALQWGVAEGAELPLDQLPNKVCRLA